jgi:transcriptional regulator with XRE-family HTH domain
MPRQCGIGTALSTPEAACLPHFPSEKARVEYRIMTTLAERISARLTELGLTPNAASLIAGGHRDLIRNIQRGKSKVPRGDMLLGLAKALQVSLDFFDDNFCGELPDPKGVSITDIPEVYLVAAKELSELDPNDRDSIISEISHLAHAARERRARSS